MGRAKTARLSEGVIYLQAIFLDNTFRSAIFIPLRTYASLRKLPLSRQKKSSFVDHLSIFKRSPATYRRTSLIGLIKCVR